TPETLFYAPGQSLMTSKKIPNLVYCCLLITHLCGAKKNKIHRNPGQENVRLPLPDSFADGP
ncbi:hypothetical protein NAK66_006069, partial [Klebsiella oxytoca]